MIRFTLAAAALLAAGCHHGPEKYPVEPMPGIVGGYAPADANDADTKAAEKLAIDEIYKREPQRSLVENVKREVQVVAGRNYRFTVDMSGQNAYRVVVFKPLPPDTAMQVTQFEKIAP